MIDFDKLVLREGEPPGLPLVPEDDLNLCDRGLSYYGDHRTSFHTPPRIIRKFTKSFQKTWMQIPELDRSTLKELWEPSRKSALEGFPSCVAVLDVLKNQSAAGICEMRRGQLWFDIWFFVNLPATTFRFGISLLSMKTPV